MMLARLLVTLAMVGVGPGAGQGAGQPLLAGEEGYLAGETVQG